MTKVQWAAIYGFCEDYGYTKAEILAELKANGTIDQNTRLEDLGEYADGNTYEAMLRFLADNL